MFKKILTTTVLGVSVLGVMAANAAAPGVYVTGQVGYADTHMGDKTNISGFNAKDNNLSNNGLAGRLAIGYQFNQNFAVEAGYLQLGQTKANDLLNLPINLPKIGLTDSSLKLRQNAIDLVGKGIIPVASNVNVYGKLGVAYVNTTIEVTAKVTGVPTVSVNLNDSFNVAKHKWAPEAAVGVSYDITPNVSVDTSWTHIQPLGNDKPGNIDFVAVGVGYNFG
jgi:OOP family OmpA-OmpF porin